MADNVLHVRVVSPAAQVYEGEASALVVPAWDGMVGVLPGHAPLLALLGAGELTLEFPGGGGEKVHVAAGVIKVEKDQVTVLTEYAGDGPPDVIPPDAVIHPEDVVASAANPLA